MNRIMKKGRARRPPAAAKGTASIPRKVVVDFPPPLFRETERAMQEMSLTRSQLVRAAVEAFLRARNRENLELELAESLSANARLDRQIAEEFAHAEAELDL